MFTKIGGLNNDFLQLVVEAIDRVWLECVCHATFIENVAKKGQISRQRACNMDLYKV